MAGCIFDNRPGCKGLGGSAVGYWGRDVYKRVAEEQEWARQRALLTDQLVGTGLRTDLWIGVTSGNQCSCYKESFRQADRNCSSCHGVIDGYVPGYLKFGYNTLWMASSDSDVVFTNTEVTTKWKSSKIQLTSGSTSGTIESGDKSFSRTAIGSQWEYDVQSFVRMEANSSVTVEYSIDSGSTWSAIADLVSANPSSGTIRFKVTLTRDTTSVLSPLFEIIRARYATVDLSGQRADGTYTYGPWISALNSKPAQNYRKSEQGDLPMHGMSLWTTGLATFDSSITVGSDAELLNGPDVVLQFRDGVLSDDRKYRLLDWQLSDPGAYVVLTQNFNIRVADEVGPYSFVW